MATTLHVALSRPPDCLLPLLFCVEEIVAHASNVSSLVLGKASGRLLATGGDDCRVNLWSINKPNCIMVSLRWQWG
jgi:WD40 repeat protein